MPLPTPAELRARAVELREQADRYEEAADQLEGAERAVELLALTSDANSTTLQGMSSISSTELARGVARSRSGKHPFVRALYEHKDPKKRMTVTEWARQHKLKLPTVASWVANPKSKGARRIPMVEALRIERELGVPASLAVWKNGITTD